MTASTILWEDGTGVGSNLIVYGRRCPSDLWPGISELFQFIQARSLTAQIAETEAIRFLVGTQSLKSTNQVHLIDFDDENNLINKTVFLHDAGEIWHIGASPEDCSIFSTCYNELTDSKVETQASIWRLPSDKTQIDQDETSTTAPSVELVCHLDDGSHSCTPCVLWHPTNGDKVVTLSDNSLHHWNLDCSSDQARIIQTASVEGKGNPRLTAGSWNPHHNCNQLATACETSIRGWDLRSALQVFSIEHAHGQLVRDVQYNPNKQYIIVSCGDDCKVKFWDTRKTTEVLSVFSDHSHWVWSVRYNHFHDQLVLTSSSDSRVILSKITSLSSEPFGHIVDDEFDDEGDDENSQTKEPEEVEADRVLATYDEHEDSVYAAEWSSTDPWLFASLSYDGRLVINRVPRNEKYKILL